MPSQPERRDSSRLDLHVRVRYSLPAQGISGEADATDVSRSGLRIESRQELPQGTRLDVELDDGQGHLEAGKAEVTWCRPRRSPAGGRTLYDVGLRLDQDWLKGATGPLAMALKTVLG